MWAPTHGITNYEISDNSKAESLCSDSTQSIGLCSVFHLNLCSVISTHKLAAKFLPTTARIPENSLNHTITSNWDTTPYYIPIAQKAPQIERSRHNYNNLSALTPTNPVDCSTSACVMWTQHMN